MSLVAYEHDNILHILSSAMIVAHLFMFIVFIVFDSCTYSSLFDNFHFL